MPAGARPRYLAAVGAAFAAFAVLGLFTSLAPAFVAGTLLAIVAGVGRRLRPVVPTGAGTGSPVLTT